MIVDSFIFSGQLNPISDVMVAGNWVIRNGKHAKEDEIFEAYQDLVSRVAVDKELTE